MVRKIIKIDGDRCNGCGVCVAACHEGAIGMVDGKAKLLRDDYCDGLGNCLPACPCEAISFEEREAAAFDEEAVRVNMQRQAEPASASSGCPGITAKSIIRDNNGDDNAPVQAALASTPCPTYLRQWPIQIKLVPPTAQYFENANLLIAADCCAYAYGNYHAGYMKNKISIIGCPKLDDIDYSGKLTAILHNNNIKSVTITRMEVPCCGGLEHAAKTAMQNCGKIIPWRVATISTDGQVLED
jgi:NAD-dependent dihydropyrimidine dehydrogenase PreA subunit